MPNTTTREVCALCLLADRESDKKAIAIVSQFESSGVPDTEFATTLVAKMSVPRYFRKCILDNFGPSINCSTGQFTPRPE